MGSGDKTRVGGGGGGGLGGLGVETSCMKCNVRPAALYTASEVHCMDIIRSGWTRCLYGDRENCVHS